MPVTAGVVLVGAYAANEQKKGAEKGAKAIAKGNDAALEEQQRQFNQTQANQQPWLDTGKMALGGINRILAGDYSEAMNSPDYLVARNEGLRGLDRALSASGGLTPGTAGDADRIQFASNLGTQQLGNWRQFLLGASGMGQGAANQLTSAGQTYAANVGNIAQNTAQARASSYQQKADANSQLAGVIGGSANNWLQGGGWQRAKGMFGPGTI
jgi:hypothetical protein